MKRKQFTFYASMLATAELMEENEQGPYLLALIRYGLCGVEPDLSNLPRAVAIGFLSHKPTMDSSWKKAKSGKKGGESKQKASKGEAKHKQTQATAKQPLSEKENEIEKEKEVEKENEIEGENDCSSAPLPDSDFEAFWAAYPCQIGRENAYAMWQVKTCGVALADILYALDCWKACPQWTEDEGRYVPRAARWLNEEHWKSPPAPPTPCGARGELGAEELEAIRRVMREG